MNKTKYKKHLVLIDLWKAKKRDKPLTILFILQNKIKKLFDNAI